MNEERDKVYIQPWPPRQKPRRPGEIEIPVIPDKPKQPPRKPGVPDIPRVPEIPLPDRPKQPPINRPKLPELPPGLDDLCLEWYKRNKGKIILPA